MIGELREKGLHAALKQYFEPDEAYHEVPISGYIADIARDHEIIEIQTRALYRLAPKLSTFLVENSVTVVCPIVTKKEILWTDPDTGEFTARKSNKNGKEIDVLPELYRLRDLLTHPHFRVKVILLEATEYRLLDGGGRDKKNHATKLDIVPTAFLREFTLEKAEDYRRFLPDELPEEFTSADLRGVVKTSLRTAQTALNVLSVLGLITKTGKRGRYLTYQRNLFI